MTQSRFEDLSISKDVLKAVRSVGWTEPTPVQTAAIPVGLGGGDLLAQAQTGTGKTGAFGSIILSRTKSGSSDPTSLVLVPTRELASQVSEEITNLSEYSGHVCIPVYGGVNIENQAKQIKKGVDVIVATPGRLKDLIERKLVNLNSVSVVVLDEADRMLDMGFAPSVNMILARVPKKRQTMMFSATMPAEVKKLAVRHMANHAEVLVSKDELTLDLTEQYYIMTNRDSKRDELTHIIENDYPKMMVFCRTKRKVDYLARKLKKYEYDVEGIHGDVGQNKRERILREFSEGELQVLIASDVASRGLDIEGVDVVVNFDIPVDPETYVHRIGRTGRAGKAGKAITFVTEDDLKGLNTIEKTVQKKITELPWTSALYNGDSREEPVIRKNRKPETAQKPAAGKNAGENRREQPAGKQRKKAAESESGEEPARKERTLKGSLDRKTSEKTDTKKRSERKKNDKQSQRQEKADNGEFAKQPERKPAAEEKPVQEVPEQNNGTKMQYKPQGVPKNPRPLHAYVGIVRAARPKKDMSFDRLELNIGSVDGLDADKLKKFVVRVAGIEESEIGNIHVSDGKSRIQVVRYRSQEVVDEVFGQTVNDKRVMIYNLSDKQ